MEGLNAKASIAKADASRMRDDVAAFRDEAECAFADMMAARYNDKFHECGHLLGADETPSSPSYISSCSDGGHFHDEPSVASYNSLLRPHLLWRK